MNLSQISRTIGLSLLATFFAVAVDAQPVTYRLHRETNPIPFTGKLLSVTPPDAAVLTIQSNDLINAGSGTTHSIDTFYSPFFAQAGTIPAGSTVTFTLYMRKTVNTGKLRAAGQLRVRTPNELSTSVCAGQTSSAELTTTFAPYTFNCTSTAAVPFTTSKVMLLTVNVYVVTNINKSVRAEVALEGVPGGNYDSRIDVPVPPPPPSISGTDPTSGPVGTAVTISGAWFGATQGTSTVTFNGVPATATAWSASSITAIVPTTAITGPVVVTVGGASSNAVTFTVPPPVLTGLSPPTGPVGAPVTINGSGFGPSASAGGVTFNGVTAPTTSWAPTQIVAIVPAGTATGAVIATINGRASNSLTFTLITTGTLTGTVTRASDGAPVSGASVQALLNGIQQGATTTNGSGSYTIANLENGLYDIRVMATGYSPELVSNLPLPAAQTTTRNITLFAPGTVSGRITQSDGTTPLVGAAVTIFDGPVQAGQSSTTSTGDYSIANLHPGPYLVQAAYVGYQTKEQSGTVPNGGSTTVNLSLTTAPVGPVTYAYDELNRLVSVVDASGASATYTYDAVGNILSIQRHGSQSVSISEFTPNSGPVGQTVTIFGSGFSATPAQNVVTFNGTPATVTAATATQLVTTVPADATTGTISVTAPLGAASSAGPFTVSSSTGVPTISGFAPQIAAIGETVTITGTNFDPALLNNVARINMSAMPPVSATPAQLQIVVPPPVSTGRVSVSTPMGSANSTSYLWVPPSPLTAAGVDSTGDMPLNASASIAVVTAGKFVLRAFEGTAGHAITMDVSAITSGKTNFYVYTPLGMPLIGGAITANTFFNTVSLPFTGTYQFIMQPWTSVAGSATVTLNLFADVTATIPTDGTPTPVTTTVPGQSGRFVFAAAAGERFSAVISNVTIPGCDAWALELFAPDGNRLASVEPCTSTSGYIDVVTLPAGGTYTLLFGGTGAQAGSATIKAYKFADVTGTANLSGAPTPVSTSIPGQNVRLTFSAVAGQRVSMIATDVLITEPIPTSCQWDLELLAPNGSTVVWNDSCDGNKMFLDTVELPTTGTYTFMFGGRSSGFGSATLRIYDFVHVTGSVTPGDPAATYTTTVPGQDVRLTFSATAGQIVSALAKDVVFTEMVPTSCQWQFRILAPNGAVLVSDHACLGGTQLFLDQVSLPTTGVYTLLLGGEGSGIGPATITLFDVVHVTQTVTPGDPAATFTTTTPGQDVRLTFTATAGQMVSMLATDVSVTEPIPTSCQWELELLAPNGASLAWSHKCSGSALFLDTVTLPTTGTYTFMFGGRSSGYGSAVLTLFNVVHITPTIAAGDPPVTYTTTVPGQDVRLSFTGAVGQRVSMRATNVSITEPIPTSCQWELELLSPTGASLAWSHKCSGSALFLDTVTLTTAGTHTFMFGGRSSGFGTGTIALFDATDATGTTEINGTPVQMSLSVPGQNGQITFACTANQPVRAQVSGNSIGSTRVTLLDTGNQQLATLVSGAGAFTVGPGTPTTSGTCSVVLDPSADLTGNITVAITNP